MASDAPANDQGGFVGLTDSAIGVQEPLREGMDGGATTEDEIVAELHLREKQPVLNAGMLSLFGSEKGRETGQPFLGTVDQIVGGEGIGEFLQGFRIGTLQDGVGALLKSDATRLHSTATPIWLLGTDPSTPGQLDPDPYTPCSPT